MALPVQLPAGANASNGISTFKKVVFLSDIGF
jgi:hypothetical protein